MKYDPQSHSLQFASDDEVAKFHAETTALLREAVVAVSRHGEADEAKLASLAVFKQYGSVLRALNAFRRHLERHSGAE